MELNLFSIFDPSTGLGLSINWVTLGGPLLWFPVRKMTSLGRGSMVWKMVLKGLSSELQPLVSGKGGALLPFASLFFFLTIVNSGGLLPYVFTPSSHLSISLGLALPLWVGYTLYGWMKSTQTSLAHLVPQGTPMGLLPFMVIIESVSSVIRPGTLSVRLAANMVAGHMLLALMGGGVSVLAPGGFGVVVVSQALLMVLEVAVAMIQAYVLVVLSVLYLGET